MFKFLLKTVMIFHFLVQYQAEFIPPEPKYKCPLNSKQIFPCICVYGSDKGIFVRCEKTNLASLSIALNNIAAFGFPIEHLTLYKCNFERLYGTLFFKTKARVLHLQDTPLKTIDQHSFYGINETLEELYIEKSLIYEFPAKALKILGKLIILSIDHQIIEHIEKNLFKDSLIANHLEQLKLSNGLMVEFPLESFESLRKLKKIDLHGHFLSTLKFNQFKNLREVEVLDLSYNNISRLESRHIADLTKLSWCNLSHNALTEIYRGTFARNSVIRVLNLSFNNIQKLDGNTFRGMRFLRRLYLSDNKISEIGRGTFSTITRIGTIELTRNFLKKIDFQMFADLNYIEIINVAENEITEIQKQSFKNLYLTNINISHNSLQIIAELSFENCVNITKLDLSYNNLKALPKDAFDSTTYATELILSYNFLEDMAKVPLHTMNGLKILNVSNNNIKTIPKNHFPKLYELHTIDISYNNLTSIANHVFQPIFALRVLNISHNSLEDIESSTFGTLPTLLHLDISFNLLRTVARYGMAKLTSLRYLTLANNVLEKLFEIPTSLNHLDLSNNWIQTISENTWPSMNSLLSLDITGNRLSNNLKSYSFSKLLSLNTLKLISNGITKTPIESLKGLFTLQYLHMKNNNITELEKSAFGKLPVVFELNLQNNNIDIIRNRAFDGLLQLFKLNLSENSIKTLPNEAFFGLVSLKYLDLSYNFLDKLDNKTNGVLDNCLSLERINLSHNKFTYINRKTFPSDPYTPYKLLDIDLSYNNIPVMTHDITIGTKNVKKLNLSHNLIGSIRNGILENLTSLEILDLSYNSLEDFKDGDARFKLPTKLSQINLQFNKIFDIPTEEFTKLQNLTIINLSNNNLTTFFADFIDKLKEGILIKYEDNPLHCDCKMRPLYYYLLSLTNIPIEFQTLKCKTPFRLQGHNLYDLEDTQLQCAAHSKENSNISYAILADIKFRKVFLFKGNIFVRWFIIPGRDIADFYISLRNEKNLIFYNKDLPYETRNITIPVDIIEKSFQKSNLLQLCVFSKNSLSLIKQWVESQCISLPMLLKYEFKIFNEKSNDVYTIFPEKFNRMQTISCSSINTALSKLVYIFNLLMLLNY